MFVKVYKYKIQPNKLEQFLRIQEEAAKIYSRYIPSYGSINLRNCKNPKQMLEISWYSDEKTYREGLHKVNADPHIDKLFQEFKTLLDPDDPSILEEEYEQVRVNGLIFEAKSA